MATHNGTDRRTGLTGALQWLTVLFAAHQSAAASPERMLQHAGDSDACGTYIPASGGPVALVVGARAPLAALQSLAEMHKLEPEALTLFARRA